MTGVAVTGSRYFVERGQDQQKRSFITELRGLYLNGVSTLHHGDAVGADAFSHQIAVFLGLGGYTGHRGSS